MTDLRKLLPCPFCGGNAEFGVVPYERKYAGDDDCRINHDHGGEFIQCNNSDCSASTMLIFPTMADAKPLLIQKWNRRARIDAALAEPVEPIGYIDAEQLRRWNVLKGTEYESPERCYMPFSRKPWKSEMSDCSLAVYAAPASQWRRVEDEKPNEGEIVWIGGYGNRGPFYAEAKYENGEWLMFDQETDQHCWPCEYPDYWSPITPLPALPEGE